MYFHLKMKFDLGLINLMMLLVVVGLRNYRFNLGLINLMKLVVGLRNYQIVDLCQLNSCSGEIWHTF